MKTLTSYALLIACCLLLTRIVNAETTLGRDLYVERCGRCHGVIIEKHSSTPVSGFVMPVVMLPLGPNLTGVYGRGAGLVAGYRYSDALKRVAPTLTWDRPTLDKWLADSRAMIPGTYMLVKIEADERATIIDYLAANQ